MRRPDPLEEKLHGEYHQGVKHQSINRKSDFITFTVMEHCDGFCIACCFRVSAIFSLWVSPRWVNIKDKTKGQLCLKSY